MIGNQELTLVYLETCSTRYRSIQAAKNQVGNKKGPVVRTIGCVTGFGLNPSVSSAERRSGVSLSASETFIVQTVILEQKGGEQHQLDWEGEKVGERPT